MGILNNLTVSFWALGVKVLQRSGRAQEAAFPFLMIIRLPSTRPTLCYSKVWCGLGGHRATWLSQVIEANKHLYLKS